MKKLIVFAMLGFAAMAAAPAKAQVSVNINIGAQPDWGPRGYNYVDYYYLPDVESYYYVPTRKFIYLDRGRWIHAKRLPARYRGYNLHGGRKVVINANRPYLRHNEYRTRYVSTYRDRGPKRIAYRENYRSKHEYRKESRAHRKDNKHHNGRGHGRGHGRD